MIDLNLLREHPEKTIALINKKDPSFDGKLLADLDIQVRNARLAVEELRAQKNELASKGKKGITQELREESIAVSKELKDQEARLEALEKQFKQLYLECPNIPRDDVPSGGKESNTVIKTIGEKQSFSFEPKNHLDIGTDLGWLDFQSGAVMTGSQFALYKGQAVNLMYSLALFLLKNNIKHGFLPIMPPFLVNEASLMVSSNLPKFKDQLYEVEKDQLYLTPTAEANLASMYRGHILDADQLPIRMTAWTSCFRREAGGYGAHERGLIRMHQFEKVELFTLCEPENADAEFDRMIACVEDALQQLGLHYQISLLAAQDASFQSAKTCDVEVWLPGQKQYYEVSSVSNCTDFQARRGKIRYKKDPASKPHLVYTLNGSSIALSRLMVAIMEVYQQADGTIALPPALEKERIF